MKTKWVSYAIAILKSINSGAGTANNIAEDAAIPLAYARKVIATLRAKGVINENYDITQDVNTITVKDMFTIAGVDYGTTETEDKLIRSILDNMSIPISRVW